ncbi:MAG: hypothetical protein DRR19_25120 [Candidatus Parabeggiatoa sp. nov. 1]|nr:MAG: hypothetical protein DRR19_25120 [Gammaproteobacteria bacterium]
MIHLKNIPLPAQAQEKLNEYQKEVEKELDYAKQVSAAKRLFTLRNTHKNKTFQTVRATLDKMCSGARRCCYCEDSCADEVEHIRPKDIYPELVFAWQNYLYACGTCNVPKGKKIAVIESKTGHFVNVARRKNDPIVPPLQGISVLIDPRSENPLDYMALDLLDTFMFVPTADNDTQAYRRANYTIKVLRLNSREVLIKARRNAFDSYKARLYEYQKKQTNGATCQALKYLTKSLQEMHHPTVWIEMKRQHRFHNELNKLFQEIPEALEW